MNERIMIKFMVVKHTYKRTRKSTQKKKQMQLIQVGLDSSLATRNMYMTQLTEHFCDSSKFTQHLQ